MPGAWEILKVRQHRVLMVTITPPELKVSLQWARMLRALWLPPDSITIDLRGLPFHAARNAALKYALDGGFGSLFFLDSDTVPFPDVVRRLLEAGRDLIGGLYYRRGPPFKPAAGNAGRDQAGELTILDLQPHHPGDIIPVDFLPSGCTLISRRCMEALRAAYPRPFDWGVDIVRVPDGNGGLLPPFSEDFIFSWRCRELGYQPWLHTGVVCAHELSAVATSRGVEVPE